MNSDVVLYRTNVIETIKAAIPDLNDVDWYDAMFDDDDLHQWTVTAPCAFVAVRNVKGLAHSTGEVNLSLDMCVVIVTADVEARSSDPEGWALMERVFLLAKDNLFGDPRASIPDNLSMERLRDPVLRKDGIGLSVVEWTAGLVIGTNYAALDSFYRDPKDGSFILEVPTAVTAECRVEGSDTVVTESGTIAPFPPPALSRPADDFLARWASDA